jgi:hypothetical protein
MSRGAVLMGGVTLGSIVALLLRSGSRKRSVATAIGSPRLPQTAKTRPRLAPPEPTREDLLDHYRLAAAV